MRIKEYCKECGREYDGKYPCPECRSKIFVKEKEGEQ